MYLRVTDNQGSYQKKDREREHRDFHSGDRAEESRKDKTAAAVPSPSFFLPHFLYDWYKIQNNERNMDSFPKASVFIWQMSNIGLKWPVECDNDAALRPAT